MRTPRTVDRIAWAQIVRGLVRPDGNLTQAELGRRARVSSRQVSRWLREEHDVSYQSVIDVADGLGLDRGDLLRRAGYYPAQPDSAEPPIPPEPIEQPSTVPPKFAAWLTRTRQVSGYATTEHLSRETGIDRNKLIEWEQGEGRPTISEALILGRALKLTGALGHLKILAAAGYIDPAVQAVQELVTDPDPDAQESAAALRRVIDSMTRRAG